MASVPKKNKAKVKQANPKKVFVESRNKNNHTLASNDGKIDGDLMHSSATKI